MLGRKKCPNVYGFVEYGITYRCRACPPGEYVIGHCLPNNESSTVCSPCGPETYSPECDGAQECRACSMCSGIVGSTIVTRTCTATQDGECDCSPGHFKHYQHGILYCPDYTNCGVGYGAKIPATIENDSTCEQCPDGTYSDVRSPTEPCIQCDTCQMSTVAENCTKERNTKCSTVSTAEPEIVTTPTVIDDDRSNPTPSLTPNAELAIIIVVTLLGLFVASSLIVYCWSRRRQSNIICRPIRNCVQRIRMLIGGNERLRRYRNCRNLQLIDRTTDVSNLCQDIVEMDVVECNKERFCRELCEREIDLTRLRAESSPDNMTRKAIEKLKESYDNNSSLEWVHVVGRAIQVIGGPSQALEFYDRFFQ
ncbi:uncharacterized protein LOC141907442 [Tubulanus polymorphus]|uniref:uncharacterized protein LOC141907442 n=1 Tax=Tubulanus polymorphus TaxID=672921 RepID=UPI003DA22783